MKPKVGTLKEKYLLNLQLGEARRETKAHVTNIRNERRYITGIKMAIGRCSTPYAHKVHNLNEMDHHLKNHRLLKLTQNKTDDFTVPIIILNN